MGTVITINKLKNVKNLVIDSQVKRVGFDLGGVLIERPLPIGSWNNDPGNCLWVKGAKDLLLDLSAMSIDIWFISRARNGEVMDSKRIWLDAHCGSSSQFHWVRQRTIFCLEREDKIPLIECMGIQLFVDDRDEICQQIGDYCIPVCYSPCGCEKPCLCYI